MISGLNGRSRVPLGFTPMHIVSSALFSFLSKILEILTSHPACSSSAVRLVISQPQNSCILPETPLWSILCPSCRKTCTAHLSQVRPAQGHRAEPQSVRFPDSLFTLLSYLLNGFYLPSTPPGNFLMLSPLVLTPTPKGGGHQLCVIV